MFFNNEVESDYEDMIINFKVICMICVVFVCYFKVLFC